MLIIPLLAASMMVATPSAPTESHWRAVLFDGQKVGHSVSERTVHDGRILSREVMDLEIIRQGQTIKLYSEQVVEETETLEPLSFSVRSRTSNIEQFVRGRIQPDGLVLVDIESGGAASKRELRFPNGALIGEAQMVRLRNSGLRTGDTITFMAFEPSLLDTVKVDTVVDGPRTVAVMREDRELIQVRQTVYYPGNPVETLAFVDKNFNAYRMSMKLLGMKIELVECGRACALRPNQPTDYLDRLLLRPPADYPSRKLGSQMRYTLSVTDGNVDQLAITSEQSAVSSEAGLQVEVCARCGSEVADTVPPEALLPSTYIQSDAPKIKQLSREAASGARSPLERMRAAERFVRDYIKTKNLSVGYASALEVANSRTGDCTEHALLLAALGRALNVPTRVATGFAFVADYDRKGAAFVPHAWTQALIGGRWQSFDAALDGFSAGHITLAVGDGDPSRFYAGMSLLGNLKVVAMERVKQ